jgi:hypothetical protein
MIIVNNGQITNLIIKVFLVVFIITVALPVRIINYLADMVSMTKTITLLIFCLIFFARHDSYYSSSSVQQPVDVSSNELFTGTRHINQLIVNVDVCFKYNR